MVTYWLEFVLGYHISILHIRFGPIFPIVGRSNRTHLIGNVLHFEEAILTGRIRVYAVCRISPIKNSWSGQVIPPFQVVFFFRWFYFRMMGMTIGI